MHLGQWARARCFEHIPTLGKMGRMLFDTIRYMEFNADSMPNYGKRYRRRLRISTGFAESAVNEIIAKRMSKRNKCGGTGIPSSVFSKSVFTSSMARWKIHFAAGTKAFAHLSNKPSSLLQRDRHTLLHALNVLQSVSRPRANSRNGNPCRLAPALPWSPIILAGSCRVRQPRQARHFIFPMHLRYSTRHDPELGMSSNRSHG